MRTALSSAIAPRASLDDLLAGLTRHGLDALELRIGDAHGVDSATSTLAEMRRHLLNSNVGVVGFLDEKGEAPDRVGGLVHAFDSRWLLSSELPLAKRMEIADHAAKESIPVGVIVRGVDAAAQIEEIRQSGHSVIWEAHPGDAPLGGLVDGVMKASGDALIGVRLCGGGPESQLHEGRGIGTVMARLAISGFNGFLTLTPSDRRFHVMWETWLGRRGGWGCGSKASDPVETLQRTTV